MIHKLAKCYLDLTKLSFNEKQKLINKENKSLKIGYNYKTLHGQCTEEVIIRDNLKEVDLSYWLEHI